MATNNQKAAPVEEQQVTKTEAFFDKYKKAIVGCVAAVIAIIVCVILGQEPGALRPAAVRQGSGRFPEGGCRLQLYRRR